MNYEEFKKHYSDHIERHNGDDSQIRELYEEKIAKPKREEQARKQAEISEAQAAIEKIGMDAFMEAMDEAGSKKYRIEKIKAGEFGFNKIEKDCIQYQIDIVNGLFD
jgi:hypothetical protein